MTTSNSMSSLESLSDEQLIAQTDLTPADVERMKSDGSPRNEDGSWSIVALARHLFHDLYGSRSKK